MIVGTRVLATLARREPLFGLADDQGIGKDVKRLIGGAHRSVDLLAGLVMGGSRFSGRLPELFIFREKINQPERGVGNRLVKFL